MTVRNHFLMFRPLISGIAILNPSVNRLGTLGMFAASTDGSRWIVSAAHVLASRNAGVVVDGEPIFQPIVGGGASAIAHVDAAKTNVAMDIAAAKLIPGSGFVQRALGIGEIHAPITPTVGMRVFKSGMATAITEGVVSAVSGSDVTITPRANHPSGYALSDPGDSGATWLEEATQAAVAIHIRGTDFGAPVAHAVSARAALQTLGLVAV